ncbi:MAG: mycofactocin biosynthesis glycosyltransferase MftF [Acidimicrobiia bacterium]|nr:mycofactocin biosynthesis glycosyltransferase MftF [Acidimicrobiia bacterium]
MSRRVRQSSFLLRPVPGLSIDCGGRRLIGGSPHRILTLSPTGAELVARWFDGEPVGPEPAHRALARRLVEADIAAATSNEPTSGLNLVVVVPVKDDPDGLATTLAALGTGGTNRTADRLSNDLVRRIVIVDDGSQPAVDPAIGFDVGVPVTVLRRSAPAGPGNARNLGIRHGDEAATVFIDAGVIITAEQLQLLAAELTVDDTVAVAPRVRSEDRPTRLARYERTWSPLDLGPEPGLVGPGRRISYVPSTCLAVRTSELIASGGFDPDLRFGEDVDLVWRLGSRGWVRYVPSIEVTHPPRSTVGGFVRQRYRYGTAAGPLARRHGWAVAPARLDSRSAVTWAALLTGCHLPAALVVLSSTAVYVATLLRRGVPARRAARMVTAGWIGTCRGLALSMARTWWPLAVVAATRSRFRLAPSLLVLGWLRRLRRRPPQSGTNRARRTVIDTCTDLTFGIVDDSAYALGVWRGSVGARTVQPLVPHIPIGRTATGR